MDLQFFHPVANRKEAMKDHIKHSVTRLSTIRRLVNTRRILEREDLSITWIYKATIVLLNDKRNSTMDISLKEVEMKPELALYKINCQSYKKKYIVRSLSLGE